MQPLPRADASHAIYIAVAYFEALAGHDWIGAHRLVATPSREVFNPDQLRADWQRTAIRGYRINGDGTEPSVSDTHANLDVLLTQRLGFGTYVAINLVKENDVWRVKGYRVGC